MASETPSKPSFSRSRKWGLGLHLCFLVAVVLSVMVMVNYLSRDFFHRFHWSSRSGTALSPLTLRLLRSITNQVKVTVYFDRDDPLFSPSLALLGEYALANKRISVEIVDYIRDAALAQKVKADYKLVSPSDTNMIIFEYGNRILPVPGSALARYSIEQVPNSKQLEFEKKAVEFYGEKMFTSALLALTNPKRLKACILQGHGEHVFDSGDENSGYLKFATLLDQNDVQMVPVSMLGTNTLADCNVLIIAGPLTALLDSELDAIDQYLTQGGRMLVLFKANRDGKETGLEKLLTKWGVQVGNTPVVDPDNSVRGFDIVVKKFSNHLLVGPFADSSLYLIRPRPVGKLAAGAPAADAPRVEEIAFSGPRAIAGDLRRPQRFPLIVAVERSPIKNVVTERGTTRIVIAGDSGFLANTPIDSLANRDFAGYAINWLLDRTRLLDALGPQQFSRYTLTMTLQQRQQAGWLLLAALPGSVLALGGLVWLRRRR